MTIELLQATVEHLEQLLPLVIAYHRFEGIEQSAEESRQAIASLLGESALGRIWLVFHQDHLIGYVAVCFGFSIEFAGRDAFVDELFILDEHRGKGFGKSTLGEVTRRVAELQIRVLHLEVGRGNPRAQRLYQLAGFQPRSRFFLMSKHLHGGS